MNDDPQLTNLADQVGAKADRKQRARQFGTQGVWVGMGMMGLIGWSVVIPTLLGAIGGMWLDVRYPTGRSWTLALLMAGLVLGCFNAWRWVAKEDRAIHDTDGKADHD